MSPTTIQRKRGKFRRDKVVEGPVKSHNEVKEPPTKAARWTFFSNHSHVLILLDTDPDMVLREVANRVGITERAVQRIILDLEEAGYLHRTKVGRRNHYEVMPDSPLRHPIESHRSIRDILEMINRD